MRAGTQPIAARLVRRKDGLSQPTFFGVLRLPVTRLREITGATIGGNMKSPGGYLIGPAKLAVTISFSSKISTWLDPGDTMLTASLSSGVVLNLPRESGIGMR